MASPARVVVFTPLPRNLVLIETVELPPRTPRPPSSERPPDATPRARDDAPRTPQATHAFIVAILVSMAIVMSVFIALS